MEIALYRIKLNAERFTRLSDTDTLSLPVSPIQLTSSSLCSNQA